MLSSLRVLRPLWLALVASIGLVACGPAPPELPPGKVTVSFTPLAVATPELTLTTATMRLRKIGVFGNVQPSGPPLDAPDLAFDALALAGDSVGLTGMPPGVYSRVLFPVENILLQGTWRGTPFEARLAPFRGPLVDLRSTTGKELGPGMDITFAVVFDTNHPFAGAYLDQAMVMNGQILIDGMNNSALNMALTDRVARSFSLQ